MCSEALTNKFFIEAVLFPAACSVYKHGLEVKPPGQQVADMLTYEVAHELLMQ